MLILTRRLGEALIVGEDIVMTILGIKGGQVRVGIDAPKNISIDREEVRLKKIESQKNKVITEDISI